MTAPSLPTDTPRERAALICTPCGRPKAAGLWVCWTCWRTFKRHHYA
jgi:hypothetical protein